MKQIEERVALCHAQPNTMPSLRNSGLRNLPLWLSQLRKDIADIVGTEHHSCGVEPTNKGHACAPVKPEALNIRNILPRGVFVTKSEVAFLAANRNLHEWLYRNTGARWLCGVVGRAQVVITNAAQARGLAGIGDKGKEIIQQYFDQIGD